MRPTRGCQVAVVLYGRAQVPYEAGGIRLQLPQQLVEGGRGRGSAQGGDALGGGQGGAKAGREQGVWHTAALRMSAPGARMRP